MANKKILKGLFCVFIFIGCSMVTLGILLPYIIQEEINNSLDNLWMQQDDFSSWGQVPGKLGLEVIRGFVMYNIINPEEVLKGEIPIAVEMPEFQTEERSTWFNWSYVDAELNEVDVKSI
jgi:hypothetical protein